MAFASVDDFETYTNGNDLNGTGGGSNWNGNWAATATNVKAQNSVVYEGSMAADIDATSGEAQAIRQFSAGQSAGSVFVAMRKDVVANTGFSLALATGGDASSFWRTYVTFHTSGNIIAYYTTGWGSSHNAYVGYSAGQWYVINIEWDDAAQPDKYRVRVHDGTSWGSWSAWLACINGTYTTLDRIRISNNAVPSTGTSYFDIITDTDPNNTSTPQSLIAALTAAGLITKTSTFKRTLAAASSAAGSVKKKMYESLATAISAASTITSKSVQLVALTASMTVAATMATVSTFKRTLTGSVTASVSLSRLATLYRALTTAVSATASISATKTFYQTLTAAMGAAATITNGGAIRTKVVAAAIAVAAKIQILFYKKKYTKEDEDYKRKY